MRRDLVDLLLMASVDWMPLKWKHRIASTFRGQSPVAIFVLRCTGHLDKKAAEE